MRAGLAVDVGFLSKLMCLDDCSCVWGFLVSNVSWWRLKRVKHMKIKGSENIREIFSIFHDGGIVNCQIENDTLMMDVEIQYLAERINPSFRKFSITLAEVGSIRFLTWPNDLHSEPALMTDVKTIFKSDLEILEGNIKGREIQVICNQCSSEFGSV